MTSRILGVVSGAQRVRQLVACAVVVGSAVERVPGRSSAVRRGFLPAAGTVGLGFGGVTPLGARIVALAPLVLQAFDRRAGGVGAALHAVVDSFEFADVPVERLDGGVEGVHAGGEFADSLVEGVESLVDGSRVREVRNWRLAVGQRALHGSQPLVGVVVGHASGWFRSGT